MRRRGCQNEASVSLFPFLAVLICTMGALIVLLVVVMQQAGKAVTEAPLPPPQETSRDDQARSDLEQQQQDLEWQAKVLAESREETLRRLREQQTELSMIEDQTRALKDQLDQLFEESERLDRSNDNGTTITEDVLRTKAELEQQVVQAKYELEQLQQRQKQSDHKFALVPYDGPHGTKRRPIYVECLGDSIVIQPEGVRLVPDDFPLPLDGHNILAVVLRAIREYWVNVGLVKTSREPYPLIIVRPHGEDAFAISRHALQDWDEDFGYELLPEGVELAYPPPDANLREFLERAIDEMRWQQRQRLAQRPQGVVLSTTSRQGGFVREGQPVAGGGFNPSATDSGFGGSPGSSARVSGQRASGPRESQSGQSASGDFEPATPHPFTSSSPSASGNAAATTSPGGVPGRRGSPSTPGPGNFATSQATSHGNDSSSPWGSSGAANAVAGGTVASGSSQPSNASTPAGQGKTAAGSQFAGNAAGGNTSSGGATVRRLPRAPHAARVRAARPHPWPASPGHRARIGRCLGSRPEPSGSSGPSSSGVTRISWNCCRNPAAARRGWSSPPTTGCKSPCATWCLRFGAASIPGGSPGQGLTGNL